MSSKKLPSNAARTGAQIDETRLIKQVQQSFTAPEFIALVSISGVDANTGDLFQTELIFDSNDPEFKAMLNEYGARLCAQKLLNNPS